MYVNMGVICLEGAAAYGCIQTLRECSYTGQVTLITNEPHLPIDKTKLTKKFRGSKPEVVEEWGDRY